MAHLSLSFDGAVAILTLSGPLNNRFGVEVVDDLYNAIDELTAKERELQDATKKAQEMSILRPAAAPTPI